MADDIRKDMRKMDDDDLSFVSGGLNVSGRQSPDTGRYTPVEKTVLSGFTTAEDSAAGTNMSDFIGNMDAAALKEAGFGTVMADCPGCGNNTLHIVFGGGRGKCTACGFVNNKL